MLAVATADWHIRSTKPRSRTDKNYQATQWAKVNWVMDFAIKHNAVILHGGDVFDKNVMSKTLFNKYLKLFSESFAQFVVAAGNHDQSYHRLDLGDTDLKSMFNCGAFDRGLDLGVTTIDWGDERPDIHHEILVTHQTITERPNSIIEGSVGAKEFLTESPFRLVISGDYHVPHVCQLTNKLLINPGSLMRQNTDQVNMEPRVYLVDTDTLEFEKHFIPVKGGDEVFDIEHIERVKQQKIQTDEMKDAVAQCVARLKDDTSKPNFTSSLHKVIGERKPTDAVKQVIQEETE